MAPQAVVKATVREWMSGHMACAPAGAEGIAAEAGTKVGDPTPTGGMPSGNPVVVALMNLASATVSAGVDQMRESCPCELTIGRKCVLAQAVGGQENTA